MKITNEFNDEIKEEELKAFYGFMAYVEQDGSLKITRRAGSENYVAETTDDYIKSLWKAKAIRERIIRNLMADLKNLKDIKTLNALLMKYAGELRIELDTLKKQNGAYTRAQPVEVKAIGGGNPA